MEEDIRAVFAAAPATIRSLQVFAEIVRGPLSEASAARWAEVLRSVEQHDLLGVEDPGRTAGQRRRAMERQKFAAAQEKSAAPLLNRILSVNLWAVLETFVEDVAAAWLVEEPAAWEREAVAKPKGSLAAFALLTREQQARVLVHEIGESSGAALRPGVTALDSILTAVGLEGSIPDPVRRGLIDLSQVRNVLLHRWGVNERLSASPPPALRSRRPRSENARGTRATG